MNVQLDMLVDEPDPPMAGWLEPQLARVAALGGVTEGEICIAVVGDRQMARMHRRYRHVSGTTDVLTFDMSESSTDGVEGDVVVCLDEAVRQASVRGHSLRLEVLLYALHGLLHLLGYDDTDPSDAKAMHRREDELLTAAGFGPVFDVADGRQGSGVT